MKRCLRLLLSRLKPDPRDVMVLGGLALLSYGLYTLRPWLGFSVAGLILMAGGLFMRRA